MSEHANDIVDRVRDVRRKISESVGHDPDALVRHYEALDQKYKGRMIQEVKRKPEKTA